MKVKCENCGKEFEKSIGEINKTKNNFCGRSCAAIYNNKKFHKRALEGKCATCGKVIPTKSKYCSDTCNPLVVDYFKRTYGELHTRAKYQKNSRIRNLARKAYIQSNLPKKCLICGYDLHFHVAHKKGISTFSDETPIAVINALDNLVALCPNHHWEIDHNLLVLP